MQPIKRVLSGDIIEITYSGYHQEYSEYFKVNINHIYDLSIKIKHFNKNKIKNRAKVFDGTTYISEFFGTNYYHSVFEELAQLEALKYLYPDLNILILNNLSNAINLDNQIDMSSRLVKDFIELYKINKENINLFNYYDEIIIKDFAYFHVFASKSFRKFKSDLQVNNLRYDLDDPESYTQKSWQILRNNLLSKINITGNQPHKIFLSRSISNLNAKAISDLYEKYLTDNNRAFYKEELSKLNCSIQNAKSVYETRLIDPDANNQIEKLFENVGYKPILLEDMSLLEQVSLFYNATHIAGFSGTAFGNCLFANKAQIIMINPTNKYIFYYDTLSGIGKSKFYEIFKNGNDNKNRQQPMHRYTYDEIVSEINRLGIVL